MLTIVPSSQITLNLTRVVGIGHKGEEARENTTNSQILKG